MVRKVWLMLKNCKILGCSKVTFNLLYDDQTSDYVKYNASFPPMDSGTVCMWLETDDFTNYKFATAPMSYNAVEGQDNEWLVQFWRYDEISIAIRNIRANFAIPGWRKTEGIRKVQSR